MKPLRFATGLFLLLVPLTARAQISGDDAAASMRGIEDVRVIIDVEAGYGISSSPYLDVSRLRASALARLSGAGVPVSPSGAVPEDEPYLYIHVNAMDFGQGLVPFNITASLLRPARLDGGGRVVAATWETSAVGLVSTDRMDAMETTLFDLLDEFASLYATVNTSRRRDSRL